MFCVYIHVPFCAKVCDYCDFRVMPAHSRLYQEYVDLLCREIRLFDESHPGLLKTAETLYLGGGTPSILPPDCLRQIFRCLEDVGVQVKSLREVSMEFNPESTNEESLSAALDLGVNRVSLGLQAFDDDLLKVIGRAHSVDCGLNALSLLTSVPGLRVSGDLMFDLPTQTVSAFLRDVDRLSDFPLSHISFYGLAVSPRTVLGQRVSKGLLEVDEDLYEDMYLGGVELLKGKGFERYEVSNFAKPGFESVHNRNYWNRGEYAGFGPGAHSFVGNRRFYAPEMYPRWRGYVNACAREGDLNVDALDKDDLVAELVWLSLRQSSGLRLAELSRMGFSVGECAYAKWLDKGFLAREESAEGVVLKLVGRGWVFMDDVVTDIMSAAKPL